MVELDLEAAMSLVGDLREGSDGRGRMGDAVMTDGEDGRAVQ